MAIDDVLAQISWVGGTAAEREAIEQVIRSAYAAHAEGNPNDHLARDMFDILVSANRTLTLTAGNENKGTVGGFAVEYNQDRAIERATISSDGTVHDYGFGNVVLHEIIHAVANVRDFPIASPPINLTTPGYDYVGDTVRYEQIFADQMGILDRSSYHANIFKDQVSQLDAQLGDSLTEGATVGVAIVDGSGFDEINTTDRTDNVLLIGMSGDDKITAGQGDDFLYGGNGIDELIGGAGSDHLYGNAENDILIAGAKEVDRHSSSGWVVVPDNVRDVLVGGTGDDTYYFSRAVDGLAEAFVEGEYRPEFINYVDEIDDVDREGIITRNPLDSAATLGDRPLVFSYWKTKDGIDLYHVDSENEYSEFTVWEVDHDNTHYLAVASDDWLDVNFVIKNFQSGDFGVTLAA